MAGSRSCSRGLSVLHLFALSGLLFLSACAEEDPVERVMPKNTTQSCSARALKNQYIVHWKNGRVSRVKYTSREDLRETFARPNVDEIEKIEQDIHFELKKIMKSSESLQASAIDNWGYTNAGAESAWRAGIKGNGALVAVIDSGVDITHPLLQNQIFVNSGETANGLDDDNNGYVDDVKGYDFLQMRPEMTDEVGHGTHVAGVIAADHDASDVSDDELLSVAPEAKILPLKFIGAFGGSLGAALEAMDYADKMGAKIINASWGGEACSQILSDKIVELGNKGILFVAAAGNSGNNLERLPEYPAAFEAPTQITVGSVTKLNGMSSFSNYSLRLVHLFAPGSDIFSTFPNGSMQKMSGTSMATPFVAGAAALIKGARPELNPLQIKEIILNSVVTNSEYSNSTQGRLSISRVIEQL